jgi:predicted dehydrogenase
MIELLETSAALADSRMPELAKPRLGFLGVGWIGRHRLDAVALSQAAEIRGIADSSPEAVRLAAHSAPEAEQVSTLEDLLDMDLDGLVIATPSALHAGQVNAALARGCAVFCQKPLARSGAEARSVIEAAKAADRLLGVDLSYRHTAGMHAIRNLIRSGELGTIFGIELAFHNAYGPDKAWFYDARLSGGGCLIDLGTHLVDLALWCLDFPKVGRVIGRRLAQGVPLDAGSEEVEDYAAAQLHLESGTAVQLACSWKSAVGSDVCIDAVFHGTAGGARFHNVNGSFYDFVAEHFLQDRTTRLLTTPADDWSGRGIVNWARQLATSNEFDPGVESVLDVAAVLDAIYQTGP